MAQTKHLKTIQGTHLEGKTIAKAKFLRDGVNEATLAIMELSPNEYGVVKSFEGVDTILYTSTRISELRYFAICALAQATALDEITTKAHLGEHPRKIGRPKGSTTTPPKSKYGSGTPRKGNVTVLEVGKVKSNKVNAAQWESL